MEENGTQQGLELLATQTFSTYTEMHRVVDFLNKTLKEYDIIFGLTRDAKGRMTINIYKS